MVLAGKFPGGLFWESKEEKEWLSDIESKGWTDEKGKPEDFKKWCSEHGLQIVSADGTSFSWRKTWFNPLEYVSDPGEHDPRRLIKSVLLSFSHERPVIDLKKSLQNRLNITPLSVRNARVLPEPTPV